MAVFLGIDVGTGGSKALLTDEAGTVLAATTTEYPLSTPRPLWSEQDPHDWWNGTVSSIAAACAEAGIAPDAVEAVGLTGQMHGLVLLDASGAVLRPSILWNDQRTGAECAAIHERVGRQRLLDITGKPALTGFTAPKILWVREHEPEVYAAAAHLLLPKDYARYRLTGELQIDVADASGTSLLDVGRRRWSDEVIDALEIPRAWLPEVFESPVAAAAVSADGAAATGLREGTPVVAGGGDQSAEAVGCGAVDEGIVAVTVGTSGVVFAASRTFRCDPEGRLHAYCHAVPGQWHLMGVMLSAGGSFRWYRDTLGDGPYETLTESAAGVPAGCEGLLFLPYLTGERTPHPDPHARGAFVGLTLRHDRPHLTRAVLEGVTFGLMDSIELARGLGIEVEKVRVSGGGARSGLWRQIMADVFDAEVVTVNATQGAAFGAALLAATGVGAHASVEEAGRTVVRETGSTKPGPDVERYRDVYARYRELYPALKDPFHRISTLDA